MGMNEILKSAAFRLAVVFALVVTIATCIVFAIIYWQVSAAEVRRLREISSMKWRTPPVSRRRRFNANSICA